MEEIRRRTKEAGEIEVSQKNESSKSETRVDVGKRYRTRDEVESRKIREGDHQR